MLTNDWKRPKFFPGGRGAEMGVRHRKRRGSKRSILVRRLQWLAIFALVGFSIFFPLPHDREAPPVQPFSENRPGATASTRPFSSTEGVPTSIARRGKPQRAVYPYSVIPGGVESVPPPPPPTPPPPPPPPPPPA